MSVELEDVDFGAGTSLLVNTLSVHGNVKLNSLWEVMLAFEEFSVHGMFEH